MSDGYCRHALQNEFAVLWSGLVSISLVPFWKPPSLPEEPPHCENFWKTLILSNKFQDA